jgi:hypothetical protein
MALSVAGQIDLPLPLDSTLDEGAAQAFNGVEKPFV